MKARCFTFILLILLMAPVAMAQYTSQQISGFVHDPSGAAVPGATVTAIHTETRMPRTAATADNGYYVINNIPIGSYEITCEVQGFKKFQQTGVNVTVGSKLNIDVRMEIGTLTESISVTADSAMVETTTGEVGRLVTGDQATLLQLNGRNYIQLLALLPGVSSSTRSGFDLLGGYGSNASGQNINGGRDYTQSWNVDGADNKDNGGGGNNFVNVSPDAIAEFKVLTTNYNAEYGQNSGAIINLALKSGTQSFHGGVYEYVRNDAFDARTFNLPKANKKQTLRWNDFGGSLGGPIFIPGRFNTEKNKLFFFTAMEFKRLRKGAPTFWTVPTAAQRNGDFSALASSAWPKDPLTGQPFPGGIIPATRFSKNSKRLVDNYPMPNYTGSGGNYVFEAPNPLNVNQYIYKVDYNLSTAHQFAVHYMRDAFFQLQNTATPVTYDRQIPGSNASTKWTWVASPTTVNTFQVTATGNVIAQINFKPNPVFIKDFSRSGQGVNYPMIYGVNNAIPTLNIAGFNGLSVTAAIWQNFNRVFQFKDDFSKVIGSHTFKTGILIMRSRKNQDNQPAVNGTVSYASGHALYSGNALADALLGNFATYNEASSGREGWFRFTQIEMYASDNWKASKRLSFDFGARYALMQPQYAQLQNAVVFAPRFFDSAKAMKVNNDGTLVANSGDPINGLVVGGSSFPAAALSRIPNASDPLYKGLFRGLPKEISPYDLGTFGPRLGFAYDLTGQQKTVLRGGYGMFFERVQGNFVFGRINNPPFVKDTTIYSANLENPQGGGTKLLPMNISSYDVNVKVPTVQNWSMGVQHKLTADTMLDVAYVGSMGYNQYMGLDINQLPEGTRQKNPGIDPAALRPYKGYGTINQLVTQGTFNYHSLQTQFRKNFKTGGLVNIAYTWSKNIADATGYSETPMYSYDWRRDRSLSSFDRRQVFVFSYIYPLPFWLEANTWYKKAFGGWQLSGVTTLQSGRPMTITISGDVAGTSQGTQRPNQVADWQVDEKTADRFFNTAAFAVPAAGTHGNVGRFSVVGPGMNNWDMSAQKYFPIREGMKLEFRAEMYNMPNHRSFWGVSMTVGSSNFGQVTSTTDPRILQLGLRLIF